MMEAFFLIVGYTKQLFKREYQYSLNNLKLTEKSQKIYPRIIVGVNYLSLPISHSDYNNFPETAGDQEKQNFYQAWFILPPITNVRIKQI